MTTIDTDARAPIDALMRTGELSTHAGWALRKAGFRQLTDVCLLSRDDLLCVQRLGSKGLREVERALATRGLTLSR
ncbi:MAG TPA: DNA-directed RNA polymerase subunit alpha C-terminal domain-containing protein [Alphaproteobacteria bacterium]|nr:DNA-directed RNA polymerase subunit alpha C-terminal domain-containing protein [Alphaproteobacteria bacterium]